MGFQAKMRDANSFAELLVLRFSDTVFGASNGAKGRCTKDVPANVITNTEDTKPFIHAGDVGTGVAPYARYFEGETAPRIQLEFGGFPPYWFPLDYVEGIGNVLNQE